VIRPPFYGWIVVAGGFLVLFMAYGTQYAFGVFFGALLAEFGWSRASLAGAFSLYTVAYSACGLAAGRLTDRWGPRTVIALGGGFLGLGLMGMSGTTALWQPYVLYGVVAALGMSTAYVPCAATAARWFVRRRGLALGVTSAGISVGAFTLPPVAYYLVSRVGWRWAYVALGAAILIVLNLVARVMRRDPESLGLAPDGSPAGERSPVEAVVGETWTVGAAMRTRPFWMLLATFAATWVPVFIPLVHLVSLGREVGIAPLLATTAVSALGVADLGGRLLTGAASDRLGRRPTLAAGLALQVAAFAVLAAARGLGSLYAGAVLFGVSYGAVSTMFPAMVADFFGRARAGSLFGVYFAVAGGTSALGPLAAGFIHDHDGSYVLALWLSAAFNALALALLAVTHPPARAHTGHAGDLP
jgi:OFA family oxalate/formate antiporter-like MFS transporter